MATISLRRSVDRRPWVLMEEPVPGTWRLLPVSAALDLYDPAARFRLSPDHPDFPATGLRRASYIIGNRPVDASESILQRRIGVLTGALAAEFRAWLDRSMTGPA